MESLNLMGTAFEKVICSIKEEIKDTPYFLKRDIDDIWDDILSCNLDYIDFTDASLHLMALGVFRGDKKMLDRWFDYLTVSNLTSCEDFLKVWEDNQCSTPTDFLKVCKMIWLNEYDYEDKYAFFLRYYDVF
jgi:hypothetical protein